VCDFGCPPRRFISRLEGTPSREIAVALACAVRIAETLRHEQSIEVVWTGPETANVSIRRSAAVLLEIVEQAEGEIILLSYAAFKIPDLLWALRRSCERGVNVRLVLESDRDSGGRLSISGANAFEGLRNLAKFYVWPAEQRPMGAVMHAKCVVADGACALITSANLTAHAIGITNNCAQYVGGVIAAGDQQASNVFAGLGAPNTEFQDFDTYYGTGSEIFSGGQTLKPK
jgi:phosphatidylserine/phosphatidylglycerophosphate/cardiolipin synthase-like enzyme